MRQRHDCWQRCRRSGAHLDAAFNFANSYIGGVVTRTSKTDAAGDLNCSLVES
jgi:hypothetical protein